jgi:hypothetical protein
MPPDALTPTSRPPGRGQSPEVLARARLRKAAKQAGEPLPAPSIIEVVGRDFPQFLAPSWSAWLCFLRALFALPLGESDMSIYTARTGRADLPTSAPREAWAISGRRGGKSAIVALVAVYLACYRDYGNRLAPGERAVLPVIAADRKQAQVIFRYIAGLIDSAPRLRRMVRRRTKESIELNNGVTVEVHTASYRTVRGFTLCAAVCDEVSFWWSDEDSANPDVEVLNALRPGLMTLGGPLIGVTTPYARRGAAWDAFKRHYGVAGATALVWTGASLDMNPLLPEADISAAYEADAQAADAEYGGNFRSDLASFISDELLSRVVALGRSELGPSGGHVAFVDPSGGSQDSFTLAVAHHDARADVSVLDLVREVTPPFSPEAVVATLAEECKRYGVKEVTGDRYAGEFPRELFRKHGISYAVSEETKSEIYLRALPMLTSGRAELLDNKRLLAQLRGLERRTGRSGKDSVDHGPRGRDDIANAACGALTLVKSAGARFALSWSATKGFTNRVAEGPVRYVGDDTLLVGGERYRDPRGFEPVERRAVVHDATDDAHRSVCRQCRAAFLRM